MQSVGRVAARSPGGLRQRGGSVEVRHRALKREVRAQVTDATSSRW